MNLGTLAKIQIRKQKLVHHFLSFLPSKEDIENDTIKELSRRLRGSSYKETLTNILEWQERNIKFWSERSDIPTFLVIFLLFIMPIFILSLVIIAIFLIGRIYVMDTTAILVISSLSFLFSCIFSLLLYTRFKYRHLKARQPEFKLFDTFKPSLSVEKILKYNLAVCRDYAKISAALLLNSYPKNKIYFISIPGHVAAVVKIKDHLYVLDQKLPVMTLEKWMNFWSEKISKEIHSKIYSWFLKIFKGGDVKISEMVFDEDFSLREICRKKLEDVAIPDVDTKYLTSELQRILKIESSKNKNENNKIETIKKPVKLFALKYDDDEIVKYSLVRALRNKVETDFCGCLDKISKVEVMQKEKDLVLIIHYKSECLN